MALQAGRLRRVTDIAVSSYSFHRLIKQAPRLARECGADCVEIATGGTLGPALTPDLAGRLADAADAADVALTGFAIWADLLDKEGQLSQEGVDAVMAQVDAAASIGVDRVRHDATWRSAEDDQSDEAWEAALWPLVKACRAIAGHASNAGVRTSIENHGTFVAAASRVHQLLSTVQHPNFGLTLDLGNLLWAPQDIVAATKLLAPSAVTVHCKDFKIGSDSADAWPTYAGGPRVLPVITGSGDLPLGDQIDVCLEADTSPVWVVEFEGSDADLAASVRASFEWMRKQLG
jgi:sugar phosphate isomerase/epimerase